MIDALGAQRSLEVVSEPESSPESQSRPEPAKKSFMDEEVEFGKKEMAVSMVLGLVLGVVLFIVAPAFITNLIVGEYDQNTVLWNIVDGLLRVGVFVFYLWLIGRMQEIKRMFGYHGAEHKTIHCYEHGLPLTPENARSFPRLHVRCGTAFLIMVMVIAIFVYTVTPINGLIELWGVPDGAPKLALVILVRILLMPVIAGISYEITVKWAGSNPDNPLVKVVLWPGMQMQYLTTNEPDDGQIECAIAAMQKVLEREEAEEAGEKAAAGAPITPTSLRRRPRKALDRGCGRKNACPPPPSPLYSCGTVPYPTQRGEPMESAISARGLRKSFKLSAKQRKLERTDARVKTAVDGLSFDVAPGEIYGLLGPNGAGKTTTLRMLAALVKPDEGDALIEGVSVVDDPAGVRSLIGFLTSELKLEDVFSPDYLFDFFSELHHVDAPVRDERKRQLFARFGIDRFAQTKVADLSTGMKQKASLAISLVHDPRVIIFDEPTNGLDVLTAKTVTDFLLELAADGRTVLLSTHIFSLVEKVCDRVGVVIDGRMAASGTLSEVAGERSLEDAFFDLYAASVKEAS